MTAYHHKLTLHEPREKPYSDSLLRSLDLSMWTPIASRSRKPKPRKKSTTSKPVGHPWQLVEDAPLTIEQVQAARDDGLAADGAAL
jgi:hypothetical protein